MPAHDPSSHRADSVVTPGNYDGVHVGHRRLLEVAKERARERGARTIALFFEPHPMEVLQPSRAPSRITTKERRTELLLRAGADEVRAQRFDASFAAIPAETFAENILRRELGARMVVVGPDFRFGQNREGDTALLGALGANLGFDVEVVDKIVHAGEPVSSTRIREALARGEVESAARMLARCHDVDGVVVEGQRRGRTIGFPTANLTPDDVQLPKDGVYAVALRAVETGAQLFGVANLGVRPTFGAGRSLEVHIFDFNGDLYGQRIRVGFVARIRDEMRFDGVDALRAQIAADADAARAHLQRVDAELLSCL